ncbi:MAG: preprotein translocase subunit SecG [Campylobacter sp.]|nr:preprotein translocase subunit SecG [Campylobacter sp.]
MTTLLLILQVILVIVITISVLLQKSSSIGLGQYSGSNESLFGAKGPAGFLAKFTAVMGILFVINTLALAYFYQKDAKSSIIDSVDTSKMIEQNAVPSSPSVPSVPQNNAIVAPNAPTTTQENTALPNIGENINKAVQSVDANLTQGIENIATSVEGNLSSAADSLKDGLSTAGENLKDGLSTAGENLKDGAAKLLTGAKDNLDSAGNSISNTAQNIGENLSQGAENVANSVEGNLSSAADSLKDGLSTAGENLKGGLSTAGENLKDGVAEVANSAKEGLQNLGDKIKSLIPDDGILQWSDVKFPDFDLSWFDTHTAQKAENLGKVAKGMSKDEIYALIDPDKTNGIYGDREWDFAFNLNKEKGEAQICKFKIIFDKDYKVASTFYYPKGCADISPVQLQNQNLELETDFLFDFDKDTIKQEGFETIALSVNQIDKNMVRKVKVLGYTDPLGSDDYNLKLSQRRADAVKAELVKNGVPAEIITAMGMGEADQVVTCDGKTGDALKECLKPNRRVVIQTTY